MGFLKQLLVVVVLVTLSKGAEISEDAFDTNEELEVSDQEMEMPLHDTMSSEESVGQDLGLNKRSARGPPPYLVKCRSAFVDCKHKAGEKNDQILKCYPEFSKCFEENRPTIKPQGDCEVKLHRCLRDSGNNKTLRHHCYSNYCSCHLGNCPDHRGYCRAKKNKCLKKASWVWKMRKYCINGYRKCLGID